MSFPQDETVHEQINAVTDVVKVCGGEDEPTKDTSLSDTGDRKASRSVDLAHPQYEHICTNMNRIVDPTYPLGYTRDKHCKKA